MVAVGLLGVVVGLGLISCAGRRITDGLFRSTKGYRVAVPGPDWMVLEASRADLELRHRDGHAGILANAVCDGRATRPAGVLTRQLLIGLREREIIERGEVSVNGRAGTRVVVEAQAAGRPVVPLGFGKFGLPLLPQLADVLAHAANTARSAAQDGHRLERSGHLLAHPPFGKQVGEEDAGGRVGKFLAPQGQMPGERQRCWQFQIARQVAEDKLASLLLQFADEGVIQIDVQSRHLSLSQRVLGAGENIDLQPHGLEHLEHLAQLRRLLAVFELGEELRPHSGQPGSSLLLCPNLTPFVSDHPPDIRSSHNPAVGEMASAFCILFIHPDPPAS